MMQAMMLLLQARFRAKATQDLAKTTQDQEKGSNRVALEVEKDNDVSQKKV